MDHPNNKKSIYKNGKDPLLYYIQAPSIVPFISLLQSALAGYPRSGDWRMSRLSNPASVWLAGVGTVRKNPIRIDPERVCRTVNLLIYHHPAAQLRLISPRCRSSTISSNIPSTPHLFCCRNRRHFMHRPPKLLCREQLRQPVCRLTLPTIVRFFPLFVTLFS